MPLLAYEQSRVAPRSALRYRPISTDQRSHPDPVTMYKPPRRAAARVTMASAVPEDLGLEDKEEELLVPRRRTPPPVSLQPDVFLLSSKHRGRPLFFIGIGLMSALILWIGMTQLIAWGTGILDLIHYGNPRTYQIDAVIGQGDSPQHPSHFVAINLHGQIIILEFPAGNPAKMHEFTIPGLIGPQADQTVVKLRFLDVKHNGKPAMIISAGEAQVFLTNTDGTFRPPTPGEQQQIVQALQMTGR